MNRNFKFLLFGFATLLSTLSAFAQPTLVLSNATAPSESIGSIDVSVMDFTDITRTQFSLNWNPGQLEFIGIKNIETNAPLNLSMANLDISDVLNGNLVFNWDKPAGATVADGMIFFSIEFRVLVPEGLNAEVVFSDTPSEIIIQRSMSGNKNIYDPVDYPPVNGAFTATTAITDVFFNFKIEETKDFYCNGDQVCFEVQVAEFKDIVSLTAYITWDSSVIKFVDAKDFTGLEQGVSFNVPIDDMTGKHGDIAIINLFDIDLNTFTYPDSTSLVTLCYEITGAEGTSSALSLPSTIEAPTEVFNETDAVALEVFVINEPTITVTDCESIVTFSSKCKDARPDETVCIDFTASNFTNVSKAKYTINWDPTVLEFVNTQNFVLPNLTEANFSATSGVLTFDWINDTGVTLDGEAVLYTACFRAIGEVDISSLVNFLDLVGGPLGKEVVDGNGEQLHNILFNDCSVEILPPIIDLSIGSESIPPNETICLAVRVTNFMNIAHLEMPIEWDPTVLEFVDINPTGLNGLTINDFEQKDIDIGKLQLTTWDSPDPNGLTLTDGESIYELCFKVIGELGESSPITFPNNIANPVFIQNINQEIENIPVTVTNGNISVAAGGIVLASEAMEIRKNASFCVDITASNFNEIVSMDYGHLYDPAVLRFDSVTISGNLVGLKSEDVQEAVPGRIKVVWFADGVSGSTVTDGTLLYSLCFTAIGDFGSCANFTPDNTQEITTVSSAGTDVGIFNSLKDICVDNFGLTLTNSIIPSCGGGDGSIEIAVSGDPNENFFYFINKDEEPFLSDENVENNLIQLENLDEGEYCIILSSINSGKTRNECFELRQSENNLPIVDLGTDIDAGCVEANAVISETLDGSNYTLPFGTGGGVISTVWTVLGDGNLEGPITDELATATTSGTYIFTVTINQTKCAASDTIQIFTTQPPRVQVLPGGTIGCGDSTLQLGVDVLDENENNVFSWTTPDGHIIDDSTLLNPLVDQEGTYTLTVFDTANGCSGTDFTQVFLDTILPIADAGEDLEMGCDDPFLKLIGTGPIGAEYVWTTADGSAIFYPNADQRNIADVTRVGTYILTATNQINGCIARDTMEIKADESLPVARSSTDLAIIGCGMEEVKLDGIGSSEGSIFAYRWEGPDNQLISEEDTIIATQPGNYNLIVVNVDNNDCISDTASVEVKIDRTEPQASITQSLTLDCKSDCSPFTANVPEGDQYSYQWESIDGIICSGENTPTAMVQAIGVYKIIVTDLTNNCTSTSSGIVGGDGTEIIADPGPARQLDCQTESVTLNGQGSTNNENITFAWKNEAGEIVSSEVTAEITVPGEYVLEIMDALNECRASGKVEVTLDDTPPLADAGEAPSVTGCEFPTGRRLNGNGSDTGDNISYAWTSQAGIIVGDTSITAPEIAGPGTYVLRVFDKDNGCFSTDQVTVLSDVVIPIVNAGIDKMLTCDEPTITLAGISEELPSNSMITWTTEDGNIVSESDQLSVMVNAKGTYNLTIISPDGCEGSDEVVVDGNLDLPEADAGIAQTITCNNALTINGSGTEGTNISVLWTTSGGNILSGEATYSPEVDRGGSYTLTVTNTDNNCAVTSLVIISAEDDLPVANAGDNEEICRNESTLAAILPDGEFTGAWSTLENSMIVDENSPNSSVADLSEGANTYIWTLSNATCGEFSRDTVVITVPTFPTASDDAFEIQPSGSVLPFDVVANDQTNGAEFKINIMVPPSTGQLSEISPGVFEYDAPARYYGTQQFQYEICSATCSELCDIANVRIVVLPGPDVDTTNTLPNAITPNGDGMNDLLLFDELIFDAIEFPKSELVIFNRWGNIVYQARPYNNDWNGTASNGDELPEGTYYFVLRLDIAEGESMKGDITILR